jgi:hypothetical protein
MYDDNDADACDDVYDDSESMWSALLLGGSALFLGYLLGRISYSRDVQEAFRRIEESPEPIDISIRTL